MSVSHAKHADKKRKARKRARGRKWVALVLDSKFHCTYCHKEFLSEEITIDHVIPRSQGGGNWQHNLVACCYDCNQKKRSLSVQEFAKRFPFVSLTKRVWYGILEAEYRNS